MRKFLANGLERLNGADDFLSVPNFIGKLELIGMEVRDGKPYENDICNRIFMCRTFKEKAQIESICSS